MPTRNAVVVMVDRLGAGYLGPYGNTWVETPEINRLSSQSVLFEFALADTPQLDSVYRSLWRGTHAMCEGMRSETLHLPAAVASAGTPSTLFTDEGRLTDHPLACGFSQMVNLASQARERAATSFDETQLGQLFAAAIDWLANAPSPFLLWLHARAMQGAWDAPRDLRERFADDEDPPPPDFVAAPDRQLGPDPDPDEVLGVAQAYAGQVLLLDACLGTLLDALDESPCGKETLFVLSSPRGFALGEHGRIGPCGDDLFGELLQVPLLLRFPDRQAASVRIPTFVQPADLYATVADWLELPERTGIWGRSLIELVRDEAAWHRDYVCSLGPQQRSIRTPAWFLRAADSSPPALFAKPDDRWEVNEVADRCVDVVEGLLATLDYFQQAAASGRFTHLPALPSLLMEQSG